MTRYKLCDAIKCPFSLKSGCDRYTSAMHCHLLYNRPVTPEDSYCERSGITATEYWLSAAEGDPRVVVEEIKVQNNQLIQDDEGSQNHLDSYKRFGSRTRAWEEQQISNDDD